MGAVEKFYAERAARADENLEAMARAIKSQRRKVTGMRSELSDMWEENESEEAMAEYTARASREAAILEGMEMMLACRSDGPAIEEIVKRLVEA